jgi:hypothetical protein
MNAREDTDATHRSIDAGGADEMLDQVAAWGRALRSLRVPA